MEPIEAGTIVRYHGSIPEYHGEYEVTGISDFSVRERIFTRDVIEENYPDGVAYELWPVGVEKKFGNRQYSLSFVRRQSFTVVGSEDGPDPASTVS